MQGVSIVHGVHSRDYGAVFKMVSIVRGLWACDISIFVGYCCVPPAGAVYMMSRCWRYQVTSIRLCTHKISIVLTIVDHKVYLHQ